MTYIKKKDGFQGQRAIIIPSQILTSICDSHPLIKQLYVTDIGYYPNAKNHHRQRFRGSKQHILIYCVGGKGWAKIEKQSYNLSAGDGIILPANVAHEYKADEKHPWTILWVHFKGESSSHYIDLLMKRNGNPVVSISFTQNRIDLFEEIYTNLEKGYSFDNICYANINLQYYIASCCFDGNYNYRAIKEKKDKIDLCISFMQEHIDKPLSLNEIASAVNLSPSRVSTLFKQKTGFSLIEYFNQLKVQKACQYLLFTDLRVHEIASSLGIEDPYYFSRVFTKVLGMSPVNYRSKRRD